MPKHDTLTAALVAFQTSLPSVAKGNEAEVRPKEGRAYSYRYADLTDVNGVILPLLAKQGLAFTCMPTVVDSGADVLAYKLVHDSSDEVIAGFYPLRPTAPGPQAFGSAITYARRYALLAVCGVAPGGDDDDAASAQSSATDWSELATEARTVAQLKAVWEGANNAGALSPELDAQITKIRERLQQPREAVQRAPQVDRFGTPVAEQDGRDPS